MFSNFYAICTGFFGGLFFLFIGFMSCFIFRLTGILKRDDKSELYTFAIWQWPLILFNGHKNIAQTYKWINDLNKVLIEKMLKGIRGFNNAIKKINSYFK